MTTATNLPGKKRTRETTRLGYARNAAVDAVDAVQQAGGRRKVRQAGKASGSMSEHGTRGLLEGR
jgi:hypothetical protein